VSLGSVVVTHPFHPLRRQRLEVLLERRCGGARVYVCDAGGGRNVELAVEVTDRGQERGERPLSFEVLVGLAAVVAAIGSGKEEGAC
jgi:Family of unknown function (DUF5372)